MLKKEVLEAVEQGLFAIYTVRTVDDALGLLLQGIEIPELASKITEQLKNLHDICEDVDDDDEQENTPQDIVQKHIQ